jgi:hypothetical protein
MDEPLDEPGRHSADIKVDGLNDVDDKTNRNG